MGCPKAEKRFGFGSWSRRDSEKGAFLACVKIAHVREGTDVCESLVYLAKSKLSRTSGSLRFYSVQWRVALDPDRPGIKSNGVASGHVVIFLSLSSSQAVYLASLL